MAMSGIDVSKDCEETNKRQRSKKDIQWTIYYIKNLDIGAKGGEKPIILPETQRERTFSADHANGDKMEPDQVKSENKKLWSEFVESLPDEECRYAVVDYVTRTKSGVFANKMKVVSWTPEELPSRKKMPYSSSKESLMKELGLPPGTYNLTSKSDEDVWSLFDDLTKD